MRRNWKIWESILCRRILPPNYEVWTIEMLDLKNADIRENTIIL